MLYALILSLVAAQPHCTEPEPPPIALADLTRFPPHAVCVSQRDLARRHYTWCDHHHEVVDPADLWMRTFWERWSCEAYSAYHPWDLLADATDETASDSQRRDSLRRLRDCWLGYADYFAGHMPDPIPASHIIPRRD